MKRTLFAGLLAFSMAAVAQIKPNIIWIVVDDLGYNDLGCYGSETIPTPHIDSLATDGVRLTQFYAYPTCTPTRAAMLTGKLPERMGFSGPLMGRGGFPNGTTTLPMLLKEQGYKSAAIGKWHLGYAKNKAPNAMGFDRFFGHRGGKVDYYTHTDSAQKVKGNPLGKHDLWSDETEVFRNGEYTTTMFTDEAKAFITKNAENPFFLYLAYNAPHYARPKVLQAPQEYIERFAADPASPTMREKYIAMVSCMDDGIGEVLVLLKELNLEENTLVMFLGDNGGDPRHGASNEPLRGGKWSGYEGGLRVHGIARWPARVKAGSVCGEIVHCTDVFTTSLATAGTAVPETLKVDGLNALEVLAGTATLPERLISGSGGQSFGVRKGDWKFVKELHGKKQASLFNLKSDEGERLNVCTEHPEKFEELSKIYNQWMRRKKARQERHKKNEKY